MEIKDGRPSVLTIHTPNQPARDRIGQEPEVAASTSGNVRREHSRRGHRKLHEARPGPVREARRLWHPIVVVPNRIHTGAIPVTRLRDTVERPQITPPDREARSAVALHFVSRDILEEISR